MTIARRDVLKAAFGGAAAAGALAMGAKAPAQAGNFPRKVIILGFDGASPVLVRQWMDAGLLPNLARLRESGTFAPMKTANPPQTPVSWASFSTGMNPGKTKIFDFLRRDPNDYLPTLALVDEGQKQILAGSDNPLAMAGGAFVAGGLAGLVVKALYEVIKRRESPLELSKMFDAQTLAVVAGLSVASAAGGFAGGKAIPYRMPTVANGVKGQAFWQFLDDKSIPTTSFRVPARFPADELSHGRAVAGLGVPDVRKTMGTFSYYTTEALTASERGDTEMGGKVVTLHFKPTTGEARTEVIGPVNDLFPPDEVKKAKEAGRPVPPEYRPPDTKVTLVLRVEGDALRLETPGWSGKLRPGEWSRPVQFSFKFNSLISIEGYAKFYLLDVSPEVKLYLQPISFHPRTKVVTNGPVRLSTPRSLIGDLYDKHGPFKTLGWASDTFGMNELRLPEEAMLSDMKEFVGQYRAMMMDFLADDDPLYVHVYSFTDRVAHMFWHHIDPKHPMYDAKLAEKYSGAILDAYQMMDSIVGDVMKKLAADNYLFVISDHGFHSFRRAVNYNTWLAQNDMLASSRGAGKVMTLEDLFGQGQFWENVNWSKSKAYALGLGGIYINVAGREKHGIVQPGAEYEAVRDQIIRGLESYVDAETGERPVHKVYRREEIYTDFDPNDMPDLRAANAEGYRASWQSSLGGIPPNVIDVNMRKWSGDHCSYEPSITKGIFFCNHKLKRDDPDLLDFFPTVLDLFGYKAPGNVDGRSMLDA